MNQAAVVPDSLPAAGAGARSSPATALAPLRFEGRAQFDARPEQVFEMVSQAAMLHRWLPLLRKVRMDHSDSEKAAECAPGSQRHCSFRGMGDVDEGIFWWNPPHGYGFHFVPRGRAKWMMPTSNHVNYFLVAPDGGTGSIFTIRVHFEWRGFLMRHLAVRMMPTMLDMALANLRRELGGRGGRMRVVS